MDLIAVAKSTEPEGGAMTTVDRANPDRIAAAERFVENYYRTYDANNRADLGNLYREESLLTFDGQEFKGQEAILAKLTSLPFQQCQRDIVKSGYDPSDIKGGVSVTIIGNIRLDGKEDAPRFTQWFHLIPTPQGSFYISNEIFRIIPYPLAHGFGFGLGHGRNARLGFGI